MDIVAVLSVAFSMTSIFFFFLLYKKIVFSFFNHSGRVVLIKKPKLIQERHVSKSINRVRQ